jgi:phosphoserine phosphatase RsbU/P
MRRRVRYSDVVTDGGESTMARLQQELQYVGPERRRAASYLELIAELIEAFARSDDLQQSLSLALHRIAAEMNAEAAGLFELEGDFDDVGATLVCRACVGPVDVLGLEIPAHAGIAGRALKRNKTELLADTARDLDYIAPSVIGIDYDIRSMICAPLSYRGERYGVVQLFNPQRAEARFASCDAEVLSVLASAAGFAISNARLTRDLLEQTRLKQELELAAAVQRNLLPQLAEDGAIQGLNLPARGVSGDFYDVMPLPDGRTMFALADVSGKGMNAALIMVKAATLFRSFGKRVHEPGVLLARIEAELCETLAFGMFVTMVVGVYDPRQHSVCLANAGHLPSLWRDAEGGYHEFPASDPPLGVLRRAARNRYCENRFSIAGGSLYLYTDGATEARMAGGVMYGVEGLQHLIDANAAATPAHRLHAIAETLRSGLRDDLTLLVIEDRAMAQPCRQRHRRWSAARLVAQTIPAQAGQLKIVRRLVDAAGRAAGASAEWSGELALAVDEACQNIIRHGYQNCPDGRIELSIRQRRDALEVELIDYAPKIGAEACKGRPLEQLRPGGLGMHFIRGLTDDVQFRAAPAGAGNRLVLVKKLNSPIHNGNEPTDSQQNERKRR